MNIHLLDFGPLTTTTKIYFKFCLSLGLDTRIWKGSAQQYQPSASFIMLAIV